MLLEPESSIALRVLVPTSPVCHSSTLRSAPKRLEILTEIIPHVKRIAVFADPNAPRLYVEAAEEAARRLGIEVQAIRCTPAQRLSTQPSGLLLAGRPKH